MKLHHLLVIMAMPLAAASAHAASGAQPAGMPGGTPGASATTGAHHPGAHDDKSASSTATTPMASPMANDRAAMPATMASMPANMTPTSRTEYVPMAAASDLFEIQSSQLALSQAQKPEVRQFAQMMIDHHTKTTAALTKAATAAGMPPQPMLMPMQADMIRQLQAAGPADFDRLYIQQQVQAHEMALALHKTYARRGDTPKLRQVAKTAEPIVQRHLTRARQLSNAG